MASEELWDGSGDEDDEEETVDVLFGLHHSSNLPEILCFLPSRPVVDRKLSMYFSAKWLIFRGCLL